MHDLGYMVDGAWYTLVSYRPAACTLDLTAHTHFSHLAVKLETVLAADIPDSLREALQSPRGGLPGLGPARAALFSGFDLSHPVGRYPDGLFDVDVPEEEKVRPPSPVLPGAGCMVQGVGCRLGCRGSVAPDTAMIRPSNLDPRPLTLGCYDPETPPSLGLWLPPIPE